MGDPSKDKANISGEVSPIVMCFVGAALIFYVDVIMECVIRKNLVLKENGFVGKNWAKSQRTQLTLYLFNITNPNDIAKGNSPILQEMGPYVLDYHSEKNITEWDLEGGTVSYTTKSTASFNEELSSNGGNEEINVINIPLLGLITYLSQTVGTNLLALPVNMIINGILNRHKASLVQNYTVKSLLVEGIRAPFLKEVLDAASKLITSLNSIKDTMNGSKINLLNLINTGTPQSFVVHTGTKKPYSMGEVISFQGNSEMSMWNDEFCRMMNGSVDGMSYRRPATQEHLYMFFATVCRSLKMDYAGGHEINGIPTRKYILDSMFVSGMYLPDNMCFCNDLPFCKRLNGVLPLGPCQMGLPLYYSLPHFYKGDPILHRMIHGLTPDPEKHETCLYINEMLSVPLQAQIVLQVNLMLVKHPHFSMLGNMKKMLMPIGWISLKAGIVGTGYEDYAWTALVVTPIALQCLGGIMTCYGVIKLVRPRISKLRRGGDHSITKVVPITTEDELA